MSVCSGKEKAFDLSVVDITPIRECTASSRDRRYVLELRLTKGVCANYQGVSVCMFRKRKKLSDLSVVGRRSIISVRQERRQRPCVRIGTKRQERSSWQSSRAFRKMKKFRILARSVGEFVN